MSLRSYWQIYVYFMSWITYILSELTNLVYTFTLWVTWIIVVSWKNLVFTNILWEIIFSKFPISSHFVNFIPTLPTLECLALEQNQFDYHLYIMLHNVIWCVNNRPGIRTGLVATFPHPNQGFGKLGLSRNTNSRCWPKMKINFHS